MSSASITVDELLSRAVAEVIDKRHLVQALRSGRRLRVKLGIDPTGRELHLGHAVPLRLLRRFQLLGHQAVLIVGDTTAMIGNPLEKEATRRAMTLAETRRNAETYFDQAFKILDREATEIHYNSEWLHAFDLPKIIELLSRASVSQLLAHETFRRRLAREQPFFAHELIYPLLQAYDSVAVRADVEIGGIEEKFNVLMGREIQRAYGQEPQDVVLTEYLVGTDGTEKMSKSLGNYIALTDEPAHMYGKVMSIPDALIVQYFRLVTDVTDEAISVIQKELKSKKAHPRDVKMRLAKTIVTLYHGPEAAEGAEEAWKTRFQRLGPPVADREVTIKRGRYRAAELLVAAGLAESKSEARRKIAEGAVEVFHGEDRHKPGETVELDVPVTIRLGKRFVRVVPT